MARGIILLFYLMANISPAKVYAYKERKHDGDGVSDSGYGLVLLAIYIVHINSNSQVKTDIVTKLELSSGQNCVDSFGGTREHGDWWPSSAKSCDSNTCYIPNLGNISFVIQHRCREFGELENSDPDNCEEVVDQSASFPGCCPVIVCSTAPPLPTESTGCRDRSSVFACSVWSNFTLGCQPSLEWPTIYNYTLEFCKKSCGFC